jgi:NitT/TauT family transport system permease protein
MQRRLKAFFIFILPVLGVVILWEILARLGLLDPLIFPAPSRIIASIPRLLKPPNYILFFHIFDSLQRALTGYGLAVAAGIGLGLLMGMNRWVREFCQPWVTLLMPIPNIAWAPLFLMMFGRGNVTVTSVVFLAALFPVIYNTVTGVRSVSSHQVWAIRIMGGSSFDVFFKVLLPGALPYMITGLRLSSGYSWRALVAAEMLGADSGVGFMIFAARQFMDTSTMYIGIGVLTLLGFAFENLCLGSIERKTIQRWGLLR